MDKHELINGYFEGSLSERQSVELERLRQTDAEFADDLEFERELQSALKKEERQQIKTMLSKIGAETIADTQAGEAEATEPKVISIRPWLVAASVILLLGFGSWFLFFNSPDLDTDQLYAANFAPYENVVHPIERGEQLEDLKTKAFTAYEVADYTLALELFKELQVQQTDPYIAFYEAIVLMQLSKHQEAVPVLKGYIENNGQLKDRATWYLALAHLKIGDTLKSKIELGKLIQMGSFKIKDAKDLLKALG